MSKFTHCDSCGETRAEPQNYIRPITIHIPPQEPGMHTAEEGAVHVDLCEKCVEHLLEYARNIQGAKK